MRVALLGTSNAILIGGYADALRDLLGSSFRKWGVGASCPQMAFLFLDDLLAWRPDVVLIDLCVNAGVMLGIAGTPPHVADETEENVRLAMEDVVARCLEAGALPVFLQLPSLGILTSPASSILMIPKDIVERFGLPWLDGYTLVRRIVAETGVPSNNALFRDPSHLLPKLAYAIGLTLPGLVRTALTMAGQPASVRRHGFLLAAPAAASRSTRISSLGKFECADMCEGDTLTLTLPEGAEVVGLAADFAATHGLLTIRGENQRRYLMDSWTWQPQPTPVRIMTLPLRAPVRGPTVTLELTSGTEADNPSPVRRPPPQPDREVRIALYGLVVRQAPRPTARGTPFAEPMELGSRLDATQFGEICASLSVSVPAVG